MSLGDAAPDWSVNVNISVSPMSSDQAVTSSLQPKDSQAGVDWSYNPPAQAWGQPSGFVGLDWMQGYIKDFTATASLRTNRFDTDASYQFEQVQGGSLTQTSNDLNGRFEFGLALADGVLALSEPIGDSFLIVAPEKDLQGKTIGVNPTDDAGVYEGRMDSFGPAVLSDLTSYQWSPILLDTRELSILDDIGPNQFTLLPSYRSGSLLRVGLRESFSAHGRLVSATGQPVADAAGKATSADGTVIEFFSGPDGVFHIYGLGPGAYTLVVYGIDGLTWNVVVSSDQSGELDLGDLQVPVHNGG